MWVNIDYSTDFDKYILKCIKEILPKQNCFNFYQKTLISVIKYEMDPWHGR